MFDKTVQLVEPSTAVVMIIDDDHAGMFVFEHEERAVVEADRLIEIKVLRTSGARGCVRVPFATEDETATNGRDYIAHSGEIFFDNNENEYVAIRSLLFFSPLPFTFIRFARLVNIMPIDTVWRERRSTNYILAGGETASFLSFHKCQTLSLSPSFRSEQILERPVSSFVSRKTITVEIIDRDQYQRNETFLVRLGEPSLVTDDDETDPIRMSTSFVFYLPRHSLFSAFQR